MSTSADKKGRKQPTSFLIREIKGVASRALKHVYSQC